MWSQCCLKVVLDLCWSSPKRVFICPRPVLELSKSCPNVVLKLCQSCLQVVSRFPQSYLKATSKEQRTKVIPSLYPSCSNMWTMWEYGAKIIAPICDVCTAGQLAHTAKLYLFGQWSPKKTSLENCWLWYHPDHHHWTSHKLFSHWGNYWRSGDSLKDNWQNGRKLNFQSAPIF